MQAVDSGGEAKLLIQGGEVHVDGTVELRRRAKIRPGSQVVVQGEPEFRITVESADPDEVS